MKTRQKKDSTQAEVIVSHDNFAKLYCYAPGDGSLCFNWASTIHPRPSLNKEVTIDQVEAYLEERPELKLTHVISERWGQIKLIPKVYRIDARKLKYKHEEYEVIPEYYKDTQGRDVLSRSGTRILYTYEWGETVNVRNVSIRAALCFFLEHEKTLYRHARFNPKRRGERYMRKLFAEYETKANEADSMESLAYWNEKAYQVMKILYSIDHGKRFKDKPMSRKYNRMIRDYAKKITEK